MICKLATGKFRLYFAQKEFPQRKRRNLGTVPPRGERRYCTSVRSRKNALKRKSRKTDVIPRRYPWCPTPSSSSPRSRISGTIRSSSSSRCRMRPFEQGRACVGVAFAAALERFRSPAATATARWRSPPSAPYRRECGDGRLPARQIRGQPGVGSAENREIVKVLDLMMNVELRQYELQPRHELAGEIRRRKIAGAKLPVTFQSFPTVRETWRGATARNEPCRRDCRGAPISRADSDRAAAQVLRPAVAAGKAKLRFRLE